MMIKGNTAQRRACVEKAMRNTKGLALIFVSPG